MSNLLNENLEQQFISSVYFDCPSCHENSSIDIVVPEFDFSAESMSQHQSEGLVEFQCPNCLREFSAYAVCNSAESRFVTRGEKGEPDYEFSGDGPFYDPQPHIDAFASHEVAETEQPLEADEATGRNSAPMEAGQRIDEPKFQDFGVTHEDLLVVKSIKLKKETLGSLESIVKRCYEIADEAPSNQIKSDIMAVAKALECYVSTSTPQKETLGFALRTIWRFIKPIAEKGGKLAAAAQKICDDAVATAEQIETSEEFDTSPHLTSEEEES